MPVMVAMLWQQLFAWVRVIARTLQAWPEPGWMRASEPYEITEMEGMLVPTRVPLPVAMVRLLLGPARVGIS